MPSLCRGLLFNNTHSMPGSLNHLKICTWNSRGLAAAVPFLRALCKQNDVVCINEHWLHQNRLSKLGDIAEDIDYFGRASRHAPSDNYGCHKGQGGVAILWKKKFKSITPMRQLNHDRICAVRLQCDNNSIINIFCVYLPARGCVDNFEATLDELGAFIENTEIGSFNVIRGDLNADMGIMGGSRSTKVPDSRGRTLYKFINQYNLVATNLMSNAVGPVNTHYGPTGETCIDYVLVPEVLLDSFGHCVTSSYDPLNTSDHIPLSIVFNIDGVPCGATEGILPTKLRWDKMTPITLRMNYQRPLGEDLDRIYTKNVPLHPKADRVDALMDDIIKAIKVHEKSIPVSQYKSNVKPYWCPELSHLKYVKVRAYRAWVNAGRPRDNTSILYQEDKKAKKDFRRRLKQISRDYDNEKMKKSVESAEIDHNVFWRLLKRERDGPRVRTPSIKNKHGKVVHEVNDILDVWKLPFSSLGIPAESANFDEDNFTRVNDKIAELAASKDTDEFTRDYISTKDVHDSILLLNSGKAPGFDNVTKEHVCNAGHSAYRVISLPFNWILDTEYIPINFCRGVQIPLYKGKNTSTLDVNNYRGITLLSVFNKLFEVIIWKRMEGWWIRTGVINQLQGACRKGVSCVHSAYILQETIATVRKA